MKSVRAIWKNQVIAESDNTVQVEGNYYFPRESINFDFLKSSETKTDCPWKGIASYHTVSVDGEDNVDAVWSYPDPTQEALQLKDHYAFWKGIEIVKETLEEKNAKLAVLIRDFVATAHSRAQGTDADLVQDYRDLLGRFEEDGLIHTLPIDFVNKLSFFNFYNSNDACFQTDLHHSIQKVNRTFSWAFNHLPDMVGQTFEQFMEHVTIVEGADHDDFFKTIESHGWARLQKIRITKGDQDVYYSLDVAITKHGDVEDLTGFQCQLKNITREVELTQSVERSKANMKSLLEGIEEGLFYFDRDGKVASERSAALDRILPGSEKMTTIQEIAAHFGGKKREETESCLGLLWPADEDDGFMSMFDVSITMLPKMVELLSGGEKRYVTFSYNELHDSAGDLEKVIVVVKDVTTLLHNEREANLQSERVRKISLASSNLDAYQTFVDEASSLVSRIDGQMAPQSEKLDLADLKRDLHTLKGMASLFEFATFAEGIHKIEDLLSENFDQTLTGQVAEQWRECFHQWTRETKDISETLDLNRKQGSSQVEKSKLQKLRGFVDKLGNPELVELCEGLTRYPIDNVFGKYATYVAKLCERRDDKDVQLKFDAASEELNFDEVRSVDGAIVHILRNCLDHGIETREDRQARGKKESGSIEISFRRGAGGSLVLNISDDGGGIDTARLVEKAVTSGKWTQAQADSSSEEERIHLIFASNLSSRDVVTEVSGRGVGMDAVSEIVRGLGGTISVDSKSGVGTKFSIAIPRASVQERRKVS